MRPTRCDLIAEGVFGDGSHETTKFMLDALRAADPEGKTVLDIGTGTGILAISAKKQGAAEVFAVDTDRSALDTARENFRRNGVEIFSRLNILNEYLNVRAAITLGNLPPHEVRELLDRAGETMTEDGVLIVSFPAGAFRQDCRRPLREWEIIRERNGEEWDVFTLRRKR